MNNPILKIIKEELVDPAVSAARTTLLAKVIRFYPGSYLIDVQPIDKAMSHHGDLVYYETIKGISVLNNQSIKAEVPVEGDMVYLDFIGGSRSMAVLLSIIKPIQSGIDNTGCTQQRPILSRRAR